MGRNAHHGDGAPHDVGSSAQRVPAISGSPTPRFRPLEAKPACLQLGTFLVGVQHTGGHGLEVIHESEVDLWMAKV